MERERIALALHFDTGRVRRTGNVQRPDMQDDDTRNHEGQQEVEAEEAVERGIVGREAAQQPHLDRFADHGDGTEQAGDHLGTPEAHLAPGQDVTHERGRHHEQEDDHTEQPDHFPRRLVRAVEQAAEDVEVDHDEEEAGAIGVRVAHHPAPVDVTHDMLGRREGDLRIGGIMHRQNHTGDDLHHQEEAGEDAEIPEIAQVARHRITCADSVINEARQRQLLVEEFGDPIGGGVFLGPGKAHRIVSSL